MTTSKRYWNKMELTYTYDQYSHDVLSGLIPSCESIRLACIRYEAFKQRQDMWFDEDEVQHKIRVVSRLKHTEGEHYGKPFILSPWEQWVFANIFGFKWKATGLRVTRNVFLMISRKCGK